MPPASTRATSLSSNAASSATAVEMDNIVAGPSSESDEPLVGTDRLVLKAQAHVYGDWPSLGTEDGGKRGLVEKRENLEW